MVDAVKLLQAARKAQQKPTAQEAYPAQDIELHSSISSRPSVEEVELSTRRFEVDDGKTLFIDQDTQGALGCGTGATLWDAELALTSFILRRRNAFGSGRRVLVLGAGCGLLALVLACLGERVVATDRALALPLLRHNVDRNRGVLNASCSVEELDWTAPRDDVHAEVVVGADLVYASNADVHTALAVLYARLVRAGATAFYAHERRNATVDAAFFKNLLKNGLHVGALRHNLESHDIDIYELTLSH